MQALAYEWRRLIGVRTTWWTVLVALAAQGILEAASLRRPPTGSEAALRLALAPLPGLALPPAALAAGALGVMAISQELRYPALRPLLPSPLRRIRVIVAKLVVGALAGLGLGLLSLVLSLGILRFGRSDGLRMTVALLHAPVWTAACGYLLLVPAAGCTALLAAGLCRSAAAGLLVLVSASVLPQPLLGEAVGRVRGTGWLPRGFWADEWLPGAPGLAAALLGVVLTASALLLFVAYTAVLLRRRSL